MGPLSVCPVSPVCLSVTLVYCGQTVEWIKMKLGTEIGLGPGHIVLYGDPALSPQRGTPPIFGPRLLWPNGWMDRDATWYEGRPPRPHYVRPSRPQKGHCWSIFGPFLLWPNGRPFQLLLSTCSIWRPCTIFDLLCARLDHPWRAFSGLIVEQNLTFHQYASF